MKNQNSKIIFSPQLARYLLQCGFVIIDIKENRDGTGKTIFVFAYQNGLEEQITIWLDDKK